ncbi:hypothetical protein EZV62_011066 [Acer yangbiense]|uniref:Reverse transcriptase Ty1/copia-type domain-containing protein n=1 Tax=Acer yangbiense TaxID=1000413 RepID=A0A5C7I6A5_9ROSI|nr:hypothetical protein EZV62_011066 [Acer yangbiense]
MLMWSIKGVAYSLILQDERQRGVAVDHNVTLPEVAAFNVGVSHTNNAPVTPINIVHPSSTANATITRDESRQKSGRCRSYCDNCNRHGHTKEKLQKLLTLLQDGNLQPSVNLIGSKPNSLEAIMYLASSDNTESPTNSSFLPDSPMKSLAPNIPHQHKITPIRYSSLLRIAMDYEIIDLEENGTWSVVPLPTAHLVAKGCSQEEGLDYMETFALVVKLVTVRVVLAIVAVKGWGLHQLDVQNAFLHGDLNEEVFVQIPPRYTKQGELNGLRAVCRYTSPYMDSNKHPANSSLSSQMLLIQLVFLNPR